MSNRGVGTSADAARTGACATFQDMVTTGCDRPLGLDLQSFPQPAGALQLISLLNLVDQRYYSDPERAAYVDRGERGLERAA